MIGASRGIIASVAPPPPPSRAPNPPSSPDGPCRRVGNGLNHGRPLVWKGGSNASQSEFVPRQVRPRPRGTNGAGQAAD